MSGDLADYHFHLPQEMIAQRPVSPRDHSRLLVYHCPTGEVEHAHFHQLHRYLPQNNALICNNSKVFACRLLGRKRSGGRAEIFWLSPIVGEGPWPALVKCSGMVREGDRYRVGEMALELELEVVGVEGDQFWLAGEGGALREVVERQALVPIPPYIRGGVGDHRDARDYQTLYAQEVGSVAAPTAGLHFTPRVWERLAARGIAPHPLALHVGRGTFAPVRERQLARHQMHREHYSIPPATQEVIARHWGELYCVGTTCLRVLESLADDHGRYAAPVKGEGSTDIFLHPGGRPIRSIRGLITNFHLPQSSLFILICALLGRRQALELYRLAMAEGYRFLSYGGRHAGAEVMR